MLIRIIGPSFAEFAFLFVLFGTGSSDSHTPDAAAGDVERFVIETRHRLYPNFVQIDTVTMDQHFLIGEDEYEALVLVFNPHLGITKEGTILQMSDTLYNPAVQIQVSLDGEVLQESWAFYRMSSPHYARSDLLGFRLVEYEVGRFVQPSIESDESP